MNYFVTFRHRRTLEQSECQLLMRALMNAHGRKWSIKLICILADRSDLIVHMIEDEDLKSKELSEVLEKAKSKAIDLGDTAEDAVDTWVEDMQKKIDGAYKKLKTKVEKLAE